MVHYWFCIHQRHISIKSCNSCEGQRLVWRSCTSNYWILNTSCLHLKDLSFDDQRLRSQTLFLDWTLDYVWFKCPDWGWKSKNFGLNVSILLVWRSKGTGIKVRDFWFKGLETSGLLANTSGLKLMVFWFEGQNL